MKYIYIYITLSHYKYGYRQNTSTALTTTVFMEVLHRYDNGFPDMNKDFEWINHCTFIDKMKKKGMANFIIK